MARWQPPAKKRKRSEQSGSSSQDPSPAKNKKVRPSDNKEDVERPKNADGTQMIPLGQNKFITTGLYKGKAFVDMREYYEAKEGSEGWKPTKKGVSLNPDQFAELEKLMPELRAKLDELVDDD